MSGRAYIRAVRGTVIVALVAAYLSGCNARKEPPAVAVEPIGFSDITESANLSFVHNDGIVGSYFMPEIVGSGVALFDHDSDGDLDIYLVDGGAQDDTVSEKTNRLFSQQDDGRFVDRTVESGLGDAGYGMGTALGDIDNDGDLDLFVSNYGPDVLYRNEGGGRFTNITQDAGIRGDDWSTSACFLDYDGDGLLDLYVAGYVHDRPAKTCTDSAGRQEYCGPMAYRGVADKLWHNEGAGRFSDAGESSGIAQGAGKGLGVVSADFDADGRVDIFVANDGEANNLWINKGAGQFEDQALMKGVAYNSFGKPEASMGVALGDLNADGRLDLYVTHLVRETNTLYTGADGGMQDSTGLTGSGAESMPYTGFGTSFLDADHDGDLDLAVANGRVTRNDGPPHSAAGSRLEEEYGEPNLFYVNEGDGRLQNACAAAGDFCKKSRVSRGLITGDIDGDGDLDVVVSNGHGPARLFRNDLPGKQSWLMLRAVDPRLKRDAIGATVEVSADGSRMIRPVSSCNSYLSSSEAITHFGLGAAARTDKIRVTWPDGSIELFPGVAANQAITLQRGEGKLEP
ncbi:MAG: CRTAC1 family protein [Gammaproteobacteria bacterium]|nr:CRTAC1 family protein [Gammaproteobacteria bacterium]NNL46696.1 CRTAC1 family protein [Woeseiaceae bacterium]